jgi:hypothetical protein
MIVSLPNICESSSLVAQGFATKFYIEEYLRFTEEGMGVQSEPQKK